MSAKFFSALATFFVLTSSVYGAGLAKGLGRGPGHNAGPAKISDPGYGRLPGPGHGAASRSPAVSSDKIVGQWITEKKDLIVEVYKLGENFKARIVWFDDRNDLSKPMNVRTDDNNPDPSLKKRRLLGLDVLSGLTYHPESDSWEDGTIYDADSGREWSSCVNMTRTGSLRVKGYWKFKFLSKSINFLRVK